MSVLSKSTKALTFLSLGFLSTQVLAQDFCNATHSGTKVDISNTAPTGDANGKGSIGTIGDYSYEEWNKTGTGKATFYSDGSFSCSFENIDDYLCRSGILYGKNSGVDFRSTGQLYADFSLSNYTNKSGVSYAYIGVYGWTQDPLIEWYIVDSWGSQGRPTWCGTLVKTVTIDGGEYDIYKDDINQARGTIEGTKTFTQYWSIRKTARKCGSINITAHFEAWEAAGLKMGSSLYEAKILGEAGQYPEEHNANGSFDFNYAKVYVDDSGVPRSSASTTPTSSASTTPTSSASSTLPSVGAFPGTVEFEDFQEKSGEFTNGGSFLGDIEPGDWAEYTVDVAYTGAYSFALTAARGDDEGRAVSIALAIDGTDIATVSDILTEGWDDYKSFTGETASLTAGKHTLRVTFTGGYVNVDKIVFTEKDVDKSSKHETTPDALVETRFVLSGKDLQVFDPQGRNLGKLGVSTGVSLEEALFAKFHRPGIYLVKQGARITPVRVTR